LTYWSNIKYKLNKVYELIKSTRWMPWDLEAMKDVVSCDKLRGAATSVNPKISEWGNPAGGRSVTERS